MSKLIVEVEIPEYQIQKIAEKIFKDLEWDWDSGHENGNFCQHAGIERKEFVQGLIEFKPFKDMIDIAVRRYGSVDFVHNVDTDYLMETPEWMALEDHLRYVSKIFNEIDEEEEDRRKTEKAWKLLIDRGYTVSKC